MGLLNSYTFSLAILKALFMLESNDGNPKESKYSALLQILTVGPLSVRVNKTFLFRIRNQDKRPFEIIPLHYENHLINYLII